ncbi:hypothetical protein RO3G_14853 [Rhizopus delemar RA 99-880]|uniref:Uncharacterized protein n=1 Tax=Rhizopus delemar (strain RA 99-880 / ATCC MYA-4621 / FGSC 9543 / NRRL 43880) TaxID=246409 RepID=I1CNW2_RHIO9|nr:hypothetical protein RO3G_14853 [Rhizopus delemar RA 99-880]|eukprot:EIE90142.1 hypothetical protein RO3G_14853 [Rhizopus delemar RA 99-880]
MKAKGNNKKKLRNTDILSAGSKVYAKKRKAKKETVEYVEFDPEKRTRKEAREERQRLADKNVREMAAMLRVSIGEEEEDTFEEEEEDEEKKKKEPVVKEFKSKTALTTVTVIEDLDLDNE